ncbi:hypothetical protein ES288_D02G166300v1 [Gossypium darwinii]|uniref:Endonuclease/exonuclease/phosphatase domain-containing protein n=2 Tax=Gossypium TaxID=3633 RepID=A0A5D2LYB2_GOSTO|nr:hypothetical protein ES288_D02G166300v1 [Gossypium darwinii]TYH84034.1 hypothetical protein ES332_D02G171600v1 [Gossypium tomentosum]
MNIVAWNCRGLGQQHSVRALRDVYQKHNPDIIFLSETKQRGSKLEKLRNRLGYVYSKYADPTGTAGGLSWWWR